MICFLMISVCIYIYGVYIPLGIKNSGLKPMFVGYNLQSLGLETYKSGTQPHSLPTTKLGSSLIRSRNVAPTKMEFRVKMVNMLSS